MRIPFPDLSKPEKRDVARLAIQSAAAGAAMYSLMQAWGLPERFVGVLSAVLVVKPTVGSTLGEAKHRVTATVLGCIIGVACLAALPSGYGTAAALAISTFLMHLIAGVRDEWRYGVVAAVALALGSESDAFATALDRSVAIGLGVAVGTLATLIVWPDRALTRAERYLSDALRAAGERLDVTVRATRNGGSSEAEEERRRFHDSFGKARDALDAVRFSDTEVLEKKKDAVERLYNSVLFLNRVAEESDGPLPEDGELADRVEAVRHCGCELVGGLANGGAPEHEHLERITRTLEEIRRAVTRRQGDPDEHLLTNALVFGLDEVEDSLRRLVELDGRA